MAGHLLVGSSHALGNRYCELRNCPVILCCGPGRWLGCRHSVTINAWLGPSQSDSCSCRLRASGTSAATVVHDSVTCRQSRTWPSRPMHTRTDGDAACCAGEKHEVGCHARQPPPQKRRRAGQSGRCRRARQSEHRWGEEAASRARRARRVEVWEGERRPTRGEGQTLAMNFMPRGGGGEVQRGRKAGEPKGRRKRRVGGSQESMMVMRSSSGRRQSCWGGGGGLVFGGTGGGCGGCRCRSAGDGPGADVLGGVLAEVALFRLGSGALHLTKTK